MYNVVDYKLYSLNKLLCGNKENMRNRKLGILRHRDIHDFGTLFYHLKRFNKQYEKSKQNVVFETI